MAVPRFCPCLPTGSSGFSSTCLCWRCWRSTWASSTASKHVVGFREAIGWTMVWISLAAGFAVLIYFFGHTMVGSHARPNSELSLEFVTGYLIEESLSVDNLFVFLLIFRYFHRAAALSARRAVLGHPGRAGHARHLHRGRHHAAEPLSLDHLHLWRDSDLQRRSSCFASKMQEINPETNLVLRGFRKLFPRDQGLRGQQVLRAPRAGALRDSAGGGADRDRDDRPAVCDRLDSGGAGGHARAVHRLHVQRVCDSRTALSLFRAGGNDRGLPLPALRAVGDSDLYRREDAGVALRADSDRHRARRGRRSAADLDSAVAAVSQEEDSKAAA